MSDRSPMAAAEPLQHHHSERHREAPAPGPPVIVGMIGIHEGREQRARLLVREGTGERPGDQAAVLLHRLAIGVEARAEARLLEVRPVMNRIGGDRDRDVAAHRPVARRQLRVECQGQVVGQLAHPRKGRARHQDRHDLEIGASVPQPHHQRLERVLRVVRHGVLHPVGARKAPQQCFAQGRHRHRAVGRAPRAIGVEDPAVALAEAVIAVEDTDEDDRARGDEGDHASIDAPREVELVVRAEDPRHAGRGRRRERVGRRRLQRALPEGVHLRGADGVRGRIDAPANPGARGDRHVAADRIERGSDHRRCRRLLRAGGLAQPGNGEQREGKSEAQRGESHGRILPRAFREDKTAAGHVC